MEIRRPISKCPLLRPREEYVVFLCRMRILSSEEEVLGLDLLQLGRMDYSYVFSPVCILLPLKRD